MGIRIRWADGIVNHGVFSAFVIDGSTEMDVLKQITTAEYIQCAGQ